MRRALTFAPDHLLIRTVHGIAAIPVTLEGGQFFDLQLRAPGIVRACAFWLKKPSVLGSASMRGIEMVAHPLIMVEMDPEGTTLVRKFAFVPSDNVIQVQPGYEARYCATAIGQHGAAHLFEIVEYHEPHRR